VVRHSYCGYEGNLIMAKTWKMKTSNASMLMRSKSDNKVSLYSKVSSKGRQVEI